MKNKNINKCQAKYGDKQCQENATRTLGNYGEMYELCPKHYRIINKHLNLIYRE